jgi:hypothetical protein
MKMSHQRCCDGEIQGGREETVSLKGIELLPIGRRATDVDFRRSVTVEHLFDGLDAVSRIACRRLKQIIVI